MTVQLYTGDCLAVMRTLESASFDAIVTDPPYELGFMGKAWDRSGVAFRPETWAEALRLAKPGAYLLAFGGTRTVHRLTCAIEDAGWEIRDSILWIYGSGFPKSKNGAWGGTACKPAHEPIVMARKPLIGTVAQNFATFGTGGLNIDACRVGDDPISQHGRSAGANVAMSGRNYAEESGRAWAGRWPANIIHDGSDEVIAAFPNAPGQQARARTDGAKQDNQVLGALRHVTFNPEARLDSGSAARFFYCAKASTKDREAGLDGFEKAAAGMVSNTSGQHITRRDEGYVHPQRANTHPTVKPTELMRYLCQLVTPSGGRILDSFVGSGSTGRGAALGGYAFEGIDEDPNHIAIARARIAHAERLYDTRRQQGIDLKEIA